MFGELQGGVALLGGANTEETIDIAGTIVYGGKTGGKYKNSIGGGGYNRLVALLKLGSDKLNPFLTLGDDINADQIIDALKAYELKNIPQKVSGLITPHSTIINDLKKGESSIITKENSTLPLFLDFARRHIDQILLQRYVSITHIHGETLSNSITKELLERVNSDNCVSTNFGRTQISFGRDYWKQIIDDKVDIFQLNLDEAKAFFECQDISEIIQYIKQNFVKTNFLITLGDKGNCIITPRGVIHIHYTLDFKPEIITTNGAGDVFGSAFLAETIKKGGLSHLDCLTKTLFFATNKALNHCLNYREDIDYTKYFISDKI